MENKFDLKNTFNSELLKNNKSFKCYAYVLNKKNYV